MRLSAKFDVPGELALLYDFVNSIDLRTYVEAGVAHEQKDGLRSVAQLESSMRAHGFSAGSAGTTHQQALRLRSGLSALLSFSPEERASATAEAAPLNVASAAFPLVANV